MRDRVDYPTSFAQLWLWNWQINATQESQGIGIDLLA
jgi:hypothetical protein